MENQSLSFGDKIARLRGAAQCEEKCAWLPASLHVLITACLMRLFDRLEQMILLWQSGNLAPAPARAATDRSNISSPEQAPATANGTTGWPSHGTTAAAAHPRAGISPPPNCTAGAWTGPGLSHSTQPRAPRNGKSGFTRRQKGEQKKQSSMFLSVSPSPCEITCLRAREANHIARNCFSNPAGERPAAS